jgi:mannosyltransferase
MNGRDVLPPKPNSAQKTVLIRWQWTSAVVGLTILGLALRLYHLGSNSYWLDEAISVLIGRLPVPAILANAACSSHPGLYYLLLHYWLSLGTGEAWARGLSALWGALTVPAIVALGATLFNRRVGLVAGLLLALAPFHIAYSQEARMYAQVTCLVVVGLLCFHRALESGTRHWWLATGLVVALSVITHLFAFLPLAGMNLYALFYWRERATWTRLLLVDLVMVAVVTPHGLGMLAESQQQLGGLRPLAGGGRPSLLFPLTTVHLLLVGYSIVPRLMPVALFGSLAVLAITLWEIWRVFRRQGGGPRPLILLLLVAGITLFGPFGLGLIHPFFLPERTLMIALPALVVLIAWGTAGLGRRIPLPILGVGLGLIMLLSQWGYYFNPDFQKPPMREAAAFIQQRFALGDAVLHTSDGSYLPFLVYPHPPESYLLRGDPDPRKPDEVYELWGGQLISREGLESQLQRLWLVVALDHSLTFQQDALTWFTSHYVVLEENSVAEIGIYLFNLAVGEPDGDQ